jgi:hypothetical protein
MTAAIARALRPFTVIGWSVGDDLVCPDCLRTSVPLTGERVSHICRRNRAHVPDHLRKIILGLWECHTSPKKIAVAVNLTIPTVMTVVSGDADDDAACPACEASRRGDASTILPVYAGDTSVREEICTHCERHLLTVARERTAYSDKVIEPERLLTASGFPALRFERRPPSNVLQALKTAGWRWDPRERHWYDLSRTAALPPGIALPPPRRVPSGRPPVVHRRRDRDDGTTVH